MFDCTNFPEEHDLVLKMEAGTQNNFPGVMKGHQKSFVMLPDNVYHYGKGRDQVIVHIQLILDRIKELEKQIEAEKAEGSTMEAEEKSYLDSYSLNEKEKKQLNILEKDHMKNLADGLLTEQAEGDVYHRFHELLHNEIGFLVHQYNPETYLQVIKERAKKQRQNMKMLARKLEQSVNDYAKLTPLENKLQELFGLTSIIDDESNKILEKILSPEDFTSFSFTGKFLQQVIEGKLLKTKNSGAKYSRKEEGRKRTDKDKFTKVQSNFLQDLVYDKEQTKNLIAVGLFYFYADKGEEMDLLICLPEYQTILNVEIKYQLGKEKDPVNQTIDLLSSSSHQLSSHDDYLSRVHGHIFSNGWSLMKVTALLPGTALDASEVCSNVPVITSETLKTKESFYKWFKILGLKKTYSHQTLSPLPSVYQEYFAFFQRVIGSMHLVQYDQTSWHKVMGSNFKSSINPTGDTESHPVPPRQDIIRTKKGKLIKRKHDDNPKKSTVSTKVSTADRHWDMENRPLDAEHTIYLTSQQRSALLNNSKQCLKALLFGDFGSGNNKQTVKSINRLKQ